MFFTSVLILIIILMQSQKRMLIVGSKIVRADRQP